ncbi:MAG: T9SS type A sorting domain-containing protein [Bacteroidota bacterium]
MRKVFLVLFVFLAVTVLKAQNKVDDGKVEVIKCDEFHETKPLSELIKEHPEAVVKQTSERKESPDRDNRIPFSVKLNPNALPQGDDPACQKTPGYRQNKAPIVQWEGQSGNSYPPDPTGVAGPNHYLQSVNTQYQIFTKTGGSVANGGPFQLGTLLFSSNDGDPIVLYDKYADRWVITEFKQSGNKICLAVSKTSDPTGAYYTYSYTSPQFPDYEKFSIWSDGYYMTSNQTAQKIFVFERDSMLKGVAASRSINKTFTPPDGGGFFCPLPADADGQLPPYGTPCPIFSYEDDGWGTGYVDRINVYKMATTWGATPTATITLDAQLPTQAFDASYNSNWDDIAQPGTSSKLDGIGGVLTFRAQYRRWTGYNSVVLCGGVLVSSSTGQRSIRWYELRQTGTTWSIYQQSTFAPDAYNRWVGSIAMDDNGSIGMAYAVSGSSTIYPSLRYTGRLATDPLNTMTFAETQVVAGNSAQTSTNRFGDYSHTSLDPLDGTIFWHTGEYISGGNPATKVFSFKLPTNSGVGIAENATEVIYKVNRFGNDIMVKASNLPSNNELNVDLFDISGKLISSKKVTPVSNAVATSIQGASLAKGTYLIRIGTENTSFQKVTKLVID